MSRRRFAVFVQALVAAAISALPALCPAQPYPYKPIRIIVPLAQSPSS